MNYKRCTQCRFKLVDGACPNQCDPNRIVVARREVLSDPPRLVDYHVPSDTEVTEEMPEPPQYAAQWERVERPTMPISYHRVPFSSLEALIARR